MKNIFHIITLFYILSSILCAQITSERISLFCENYDNSPSPFEERYDSLISSEKFTAGESSFVTCIFKPPDEDKPEIAYMVERDSLIYFESNYVTVDSSSVHKCLISLVLDVAWDNKVICATINMYFGILPKLEIVEYLVKNIRVFRGNNKWGFTNPFPLNITIFLKIKGKT